MLVELALEGPDDDGDFVVRSCPQSGFLVFWDLIPIISGGTPKRGCMAGALPPLPFEMGGIGALT